MKLVLATLTLLTLTLALGARPAAADPGFARLDYIEVKDVTATSTYADPHDAYAAAGVLDYETRGDQMGMQPQLWSAWCEGKPDEGLGEAVTITLAHPRFVDHLRIAAGVQRTAALFKANNQLTKLEVIADGASQMIQPGGFGDWSTVAIKKPVSTIVLKIAAVKKGKMNDSCISAVDLAPTDNEGDRMMPVIGFAPAALAALPGALAAIQAALTDPAHKGLEPYIEFPFENLDTWWARVSMHAGAAPTKVKTWPALVAQCKAYDARRAALVAKYGDGDEPIGEQADPKGCPQPAGFDLTDENESVYVTMRGPDALVINFRTHNEETRTWTMHWRGGRWRLAVVGY